MKYLKYALYIIIGLVLFFFGNGLITPSISYESEILVNKPVDEAWAVMSDESKIAEWLEGITKIEPVSGTSNSVGAVSKVYFEENGEEMIMEETITAFETNKQMAMTFTMDFMNMDYEMNFEEKEGKTLIRTKSKTMGNGIFAKSMVSFMPGSMKKQEDINLNKLKKAIEENTKNYSPTPSIESTENVVNE